MIRTVSKCPKEIPNKIGVTMILYSMQNYLCHKCGCYMNEPLPPHHALLHNQEANRSEWPLLVHHFINLVILCQPCHKEYSCYMQLDYDAIKDVYAWIQEDKNKCKTVRQQKANAYEEFKDRINWCTAPKKLNIIGEKQ